jgi:hypothetical protein
LKEFEKRENEEGLIHLPFRLAEWQKKRWISEIPIG